MERY